MPFVPLSPEKLVDELAAWIQRRRDEGRSEDSRNTRSGTVIGFDGPPESGLDGVLDDVADVLRRNGIAVVRASTQWWWRPAALRLELGRQDVEMLLTGWVDSAAITRELLEPIARGGFFISRLRDPGTDRPVRQPPAPAPDQPVVLLDGPFLLAAALVLDGLVGLRIGEQTLRRLLPAERQWWLEAYRTYRDRYHPFDRADVVISYDHPASPAAVGLREGRR